MPVFILLLFLGVAVLWLLLSFCFIPYPIPQLLVYQGFAGSLSFRFNRS